MLGAEDVRFINHNSQEFLSSDGELGTISNSLICYLSFSEQPARWRFVVIFNRLKEVHSLVFGHISLSDPKFQCFQPSLAAFSLPKIHPSNDIIRPLRQCSVNLSFRQKPRNVTVTLDVPQLFHSILQMRKQVERYNLPYGSTKWISNQKRV